MSYVRDVKRITEKYPSIEEDFKQLVKENSFLRSPSNSSSWSLKIS